MSARLGDDQPLLGLLRDRCASRADAAVEFCRDLVRIPSPSGDEERAARRTVEEMERLGLDDVRIDEFGNALGRVRGRETGPATLLDAHLDHVDVGDLSAWPHPPFEGLLADGRIWGRGSTDTKSAVASQVVAAGVLADLVREGAVELARDVVVAGVVQEEVGGLGTAGLLDSETFGAAIVGEPSLGGLSFGHRGRVEVEVVFRGKAAHASRPDWGINPHGSLARFVQGIDELAHDDDSALGPSSAAPTLVNALPNSPNVIPAELRLTLDWRNVPSERPETVRERVLALARASVEQGVTCEVRTPTRRLVSWSGEERRVERVSRPFGTDPDGPVFAEALSVLRRGTGREVPAISWDFASDGGWLQAAGVTCVGYGPGEMQVMHAVNESVSTDLVGEAVLGNALLALVMDARRATAAEPPPGDQTATASG